MSPDSDSSPTNNQADQSSSSPERSNTNGNAGFVKYSQLAKLPQNHIDELNLRLQNITDPSEVQYAEVASPQPTFGSDINPSVGDISDRESELNIRQLESSVSSLSGVMSSTVGSPLSPRNDPRSGFAGRETDF